MIERIVSRRKRKQTYNRNIKKFCTQQYRYRNSRSSAVVSNNNQIMKISREILFWIFPSVDADKLTIEIIRNLVCSGRSSGVVSLVFVTKGKMIQEKAGLWLYGMCKVATR